MKNPFGLHVQHMLKSRLFQNFHYYNHGQKPWGRFALLALLRTRQMLLNLHLPNLTPNPPYNVEN